MKKIAFCILVLNSLLFAQISAKAQSKLQSLILPGMGEFNLGYEKKAQSFFIREAALWLLCLSGKQASNWYKSDYRAFAELHSGADMNGKDYLYAVNIGHYNSMEEYNDTRARQRNMDDLYEEGEGNEWQWNNTENRIYFDKLRIQSVTYDKYASFAIGGLILHRIISMIDVIYLERRDSKMILNPELSTKAGNIQLKLHIDL